MAEKTTETAVENASENDSGANVNIADAVKQAVGDVVGEIKPTIDAISQRQKETEDTIKQLAGNAGGDGASAQSPQRVFGAPGIRRGENTMNSRGYSIAKVAQFLSGQIGAEQCRVEHGIHERLNDIYCKNGTYQKQQKNSILVPFGSRHLVMLDQNFAGEVREVLQASVANPDVGEILWAIKQNFGSAAVAQALSRWDDTGGGSLIGLPEQGELIELVRAREVFSQAGARELTLPPQGQIQFPRQTGATTAYWVGESESITASEPTTGTVTLVAKKLAVLVKSPNELLRFATPAWEAFLRDDMAQVMARKFDSSALTATGSNLEPKGLLNYDGVVNNTGGTGIVSTDTNGDTLLAEGPMKIIASIEDNDHDTSDFTFIMRPQLWAALVNRRADAVSAGDAAGGFMFSANRDQITNGMPPTLHGKRVVTSTTVPNDRAKGSGTDLTMVFAGVFSQYLIARSGVIEFANSTQGDTPFQQDETWLRAITLMDSSPRHEDAFQYCDDLLETT